MADRATTTSTSDVHPLSGSSQPGSAPPAFEPVTAGHPKPRIGSSAPSWFDQFDGGPFDYSAHLDRELIEACGKAHDLLEREEAAWDAVGDLNEGEDEPRLVAARQTTEEVREISLALALAPARTVEGIGAKARVLRTALFKSNGVFQGAIDDHADLLLSALDDACSRIYWAGSEERSRNDLDSVSERVGLNTQMLSPSDRILVQRAKELSRLARRQHGGAVLARLAPLTGMRPESLIALAMKADAGLDAKSHLPEDREVDDLAYAVLRDACHLATASMSPGVARSPALRETFAFREAVCRWANATIESVACSEMASRIEDLMIADGVPEALHVRPTDARLFSNTATLPDIGERTWFGHPKTIEALRGKQDGLTGLPKGHLDPAERKARIAEILAAYDGWESAKQTEIAATCFDRAVSEDQVASDAEKVLLREPVTTLQGLMVKARIVLSINAGLWGDLGILEEAIAEGTNGGALVPEQCIMRDLMRLAVAHDLSIERLAGEDPDPRQEEPDRRAVAAYREWLDMESRLLAAEMYPKGGDTAVRFVPVNTSASRYHFPIDAGVSWRDMPQPSARAEAMCRALGIDWTTDSERDGSFLPVVSEAAARVA